MEIEESAYPWIGNFLAGSIRCTVMAGLCIASSGSRPASTQTLTGETLKTQIQIYAAESLCANPPGMAPVPAGRIWSHLGSLYEDAGMYAQAEMAYLHAIRLLEAAPVSGADLARAIDDLGTLYMVRGDTRQAERAEQRALQIREAQGLTGDLPRSWYHLATLSLREHRAERARKYAGQAADQLHADVHATPDDQINAQFVLAMSLCRLRRYTKAIAIMQGAMAVVHRAYGPEDFPSGFGSFLLGYAYWKSGDAARAGNLLRDGSELVEKQLGWTHPVSVSIMTQYQRFLRSTHQRDAARCVGERLKQARETPGFRQGSETMSVAALF